MESLSLNLIYEICGYSPYILITFTMFNKTMKQRFYKSAGHLHTLLEEVLNFSDIRELDFD